MTYQPQNIKRQAVQAFILLILVGSLLCTSPVYGEEKGLVGYWKFDGISGRVTKDSSPGGIDGKIFGNYLRAKGVDGSCLVFNGVDSYVEIPASKKFQFSKGITVQFWVKPLKDQVGIAYQNQSWMAFLYNKHVRQNVRLNKGEKIGGFAISPKIGKWRYVFTRQYPELGKWYHLAMTYDGKFAKVYINGSVAGQYDIDEEHGNMAGQREIMGQLKTQKEPIFIGKYLSAGEFFKGSIDEFKIYTRALSAKEIKSCYQSIAKNLGENQKGKCSATQRTTARVRGKDALIGHWRLDKDLLDSSEKANNGIWKGDRPVPWSNLGGGLSALKIDGKDGYVEIPDSDSLNPADAISVEMWLKLHSAGQTDKGLVAKWSTGSTGYMLYLVPAHLKWNHVRFYINGECIGQKTLLSTNKWYHIVGTYSSSANATDMKLYVNGKLETKHQKHNSPYSPIKKDPRGLFVGTYMGRERSIVDGLIDNVKIYNHALTAKEIKARYEKGGSRKQAKSK
ncbi:MAG: LamG domain-containing protein [Phycisphaerae bacterium]|nr:LamG domain-containing protein [Phycisphaerae bacterium]